MGHMYVGLGRLKLDLDCDNIYNQVNKRQELQQFKTSIKL